MEWILFCSREGRDAVLWHMSHRADLLTREIADRHYNRRNKGSMNFAPPGRCQVFYCHTSSGQAFWITSFQYEELVKHEWGGAWVCSAFRNEGAARSSDLIREAVAATKHFYAKVPSKGMVTFVDTTKIIPKRQPGWCFLKAGFKYVGETTGGLVTLQLLPEDMPKAEPPLTTYGSMDGYKARSRGVRV